MKLYILLLVVGLVLASGCVENKYNYEYGLTICLQPEIATYPIFNSNLVSACIERNEKAAKYDEMMNNQTVVLSYGECWNGYDSKICASPRPNQTAEVN